MINGELRDRTKNFASRVIKLYTELPLKRMEVQVLGKQMLRSGTSVAANYREAFRARSGADFIAKLGICIQEADETQLWLELLRDDCGVKSENLSWLVKEADELLAIFVTIVKKSKSNQA